MSRPLGPANRTFMVSEEDLRKFGDKVTGLLSEGLGMTAISERLGLTKNTINKRMVRYRKLLGSSV